MAIELHFEKADNTPWGFRLTGGTEFEVPLTVVKVTEDSIAENAGMQVGDLIVRINNVPTAGLTHSEAHDVILGAGNDFVLAIRRGDLSDLLPRLLSESVKQEETVEDDRFNTLEKEESKDSDLNITDEEIATIIGEPVQHHPSPEQSITQSEVLQAVNIESEEKKTPEKKWSTFLQKPRNPVPKPRKVPDDGPKGPAYRVIIKKQPKKSLETSEPLVDQIDAKTEESNPKSDQAQLTTEETEEHEESKEQQETADDGLEDKELEASSKEEQEDDNQEKHPGREEEENEDAGSKEEHDSAPESRRDSEARRSSLNLEEQLAQVQKQLLALSRLPSAIQSTLNAVTQQLELIVSASHHEEVIQKEILEASEEEEQIEEEMYVEKALSTLDEEEGEAEERTVEEAVREETAEEHGAYETSSLEEYERHEIEVTEEELEAQREEQERLDKKEKDLEQLEDFRQRRLEQRPTYPLTPLQRPIILPGGRRWSQPHDAISKIRRPSMTDDRIATTINTYSEVIVNHWNHIWPWSDIVKPVYRINFLKYQPPPKNLDHLQRSEVYKIIHDMEPPLKGIVARETKVLAEQDYYAEKQQQSGQLSPQMER